MTPPPSRPARPEPPEIAELRALRVSHPELAPAVDLQVDLMELFRRLLARIPTPPVPASPLVLTERLRSGMRMLELDDLPLEWSELRLALRQTADILARHDSIETSHHDTLSALVRDAEATEQLLRSWYGETARGPLPAPSSDRPPMFDDIAGLALRPFLSRTLEVTVRQVSVTEWGRSWCPYCGAEPDFAVLLDDSHRALVCSRCLGRWEWEAVGCPWCPTRDRARLPMFASRDRRYRVYACQVCRRYLKAVDARRTSRPVMPPVDAIATLPLDAAAVQQGFVGA